MGIFFDLFTNSIFCVFYGFLIAIVVTVGLYMVWSSIKPETTRSLSFILSLVLLFIVLSINMSIMVGAVKIKGMANRSITAIEQLQDVINNTDINNIGQSISDGDYINALQQLGRASNNLDIENIQELKNRLGDHWDLLRLYFDSYDMSLAMLFISPTQTIGRFNSKMNYVIISNVLWSLAFFILVLIVAMYNAKMTGKPSNSKFTASSRRHNRYDEDF